MKEHKIKEKGRELARIRPPAGAFSLIWPVESNQQCIIHICNCFLIENCEKTSTMSCVDVENVNCDVLNPSVSEDVSLVGTVVACEEDAFSLYNDYAFRLGCGFSNIVGPYYIDKAGQRERYVRKKSIVEIKCNQAKGKRTSALTHASRIKTVV
ncbi:hypothetical protein M9H77_04535 [Catharanthus roseus]|uniref:Uncharacterized protein n=1 Tax=Catharanthus roseus TaxID=4058 RepID=A0ACC0CEP5_CATRO|nr:hypothetical protein M9H77_04535 [Catharanthus roseus]